MGCFLLVFFILPAGKSFTNVGEKNLSLKEAGSWIHGQINDKKNILLTGNDVRIPFLVNLENKFIYHKRLRNIERYAYKHGINMIIIIMSPEKKEALPAFKKYRILKRFRDRKNIVIIAGKLDN